MIEEKIVAFLEACGARDITINDGNIRCTCPFHNGNNPSSLSVLLDSGKIHCFACGYRGDLYDLLEVKKEKKELTFSDKSIHKQNLSDIAEAVINSMHLRFDAPQLKERCGSEDILRTVGAAYATSGLYAGRTIFLYRDNKQVLHGFKIRKQKDFTIDNYYDITSVFFMEHLWIPRSPIILVEGEWDAIRLHELGFSNAFAIGGSDLTKGRIDNLKSKKIKTVLLALDNDVVGLQKTQTIAYKLKDSFTVYQVMYECSDPWELKTKQDFLNGIANAIRL